MLRTALLLSGLGLIGLCSLPAAAQDRGWSGQTVTCSSNDKRRHDCQTPFRGRAVLVENLSGTRCVEGDNWGSDRGRLWVDHGCRGRFAEARGGWGDGGGPVGDGRSVRCESQDKRQHVCDTGWRSAVLVRQLSSTRCVEGRNWGQRNGSVWVDDGCRAEFAQGRGRGGGNDWEPRPGQGGGRSGYSLTCSSNDQRQQRCDWDHRQGRPQLLQQLSSTPCVEGRTWGYRDGTLWVNDGCRARFGAR